MRPDVHVAALRAAAKVAFSMVLLNACAAGEEASEKSDLASTNDALTKPAPTPSYGGGSDTKSCESLLAATFPDDKYQWEPVAEPADVVACCEKEITKFDQTFRSAYRWDCCVAFDPAADAGTVASHHETGACTPWGPPVPPKMDRLARKRSRLNARDRAVAAAMAVA